MTSNNIRLSIIVTVYNKEKYIANTIHSLLNQANDSLKNDEIEYIFVDDASSDDSVAVIRKEIPSTSHLTIIENNENAGPSIRTNQAANIARGDYLYFIDGDDVAPKGAAARMLELVEKEGADIIYGRWKKCNEPASKLIGMDIAEDINYNNYVVSNNPLKYIMKGGFVRMTQLCRKELFVAAGGCDERIFIQDESLPLRLCANASRFIDYRANVVLVPLEEDETSGKPNKSHLSSDKTQQHKDRFLAYYYFLQDYGKKHLDIAPILYNKALSSYWKYLRKKKAFPYFDRIFWHYILGKVIHMSPDDSILSEIYEIFDKIEDLR